MIKIINDPKFNPSYPEDYAWGKIDSLKFSNFGYALSNLIYQDLKTKNRNLVPGLRKALNVMAENEQV